VGTTEQIGLRDRRKPGHCWQDNELYDAYQPVIGSLPVLVYVQATRHCYGSMAKFSLRSMAESSGISKDTVRRALLIMQEIGMLRACGGAPGRAAEYELVDLKDLAAHLGAQYDRRRASYVFPEAIVAELRAKVEKVLGKTQGKTVSVRDSSHSVKRKATVSQRDSLFVEKAAEKADPGVSPRDAAVSLGAKTVSPEGRPYISNTQNNKTTSPLPLPASGKGKDTGIPNRDTQLLEAAHAVCAEVGIAEPRREKEIRRAIALYCDRERMSPAEVAAAMIAAWREYREAREDMRFPWGARKFIIGGHWADPRSWPRDRWEQPRGPDARVGMR
jgi:hypothetical protein